MNAKQVEKILIENGWKFTRQVGSHKIYKKPGNPNSIPVPFHSSRDLKPGTLNSIFKQAGLKK